MNSLMYSFKKQLINAIYKESVEELLSKDCIDF